MYILSMNLKKMYIDRFALHVSVKNFAFTTQMEAMMMIYIYIHTYMSIYIYMYIHIYVHTYIRHERCTLCVYSMCVCAYIIYEEFG